MCCCPESAVVPGVSRSSLLLELDASLMYILLCCLLTDLDSLLVCPIVMSGFKFSHASKRTHGNRTTLSNARGLHPAVWTLPLGLGSYKVSLAPGTLGLADGENIFLTLTPHRVHCLYSLTAGLGSHRQWGPQLLDLLPVVPPPHFLPTRVSPGLFTATRFGLLVFSFWRLVDLRLFRLRPVGQTSP